MRRLRGLAASLGDSGAASAASFLIGIVALQTLGDEEMALYALLFSAGVAAMVIPQQMSFLPRRLRINREIDSVRPRYRLDALATAPHTALAAMLTVAAGTPLYGATGVVSAVGMATGAAIWVAASSFQDHVRTSLHVTGHHHHAASVSLAHLAFTAAGLVCASLLSAVVSDPIRSSIPFGILALSNLVSAVLGVLLHRTTTPTGDLTRIPLSVGLRTAISGVIFQSSNYAVNLLVALVLGATALTNLEAARIAAQPVLVAGTALASYFMPPAIRSQAKGDVRDSYRRIGIMAAFQFAFGGAYAAAVPVVASAISLLAGRAIDVGLTVARVGAFSLHSTVAPLNQLNLAAERYRLATVSTAISVVVSLISLAALMPALHTYAVPVATAISALIRAGGILWGGRGVPG